MPRFCHSTIRHSNLIRHSCFVIRHSLALLVLSTAAHAATPPLIPFPTHHEPHDGSFTFTHPTILASHDLLPLHAPENRDSLQFLSELRGDCQRRTHPWQSPPPF
ncbi:MAG TPA: hypothetical protein VM008_18585 [Phycisphaerae bacterium]|nr:hypothetical protein [Phycisphaerae bacterium]